MLQKLFLRVIFNIVNNCKKKKKQLNKLLNLNYFA